MSFSIHAAGRIADVIEQVKAHDFGGGDTSQAEAVRAFVLSELQAWPDGPYYRGVVVESSGHHDGSSRNVTLTLRALHIREPKPEGDA
jgi:hypothetical protein